MRSAGCRKNPRGSYLCQHWSCQIERDRYLSVIVVLNPGSRSPVEILCSSWLGQLDGQNLKQNLKLVLKHHSAATAGPRRLSSDLPLAVHVRTAGQPVKKLAN